MRTRHVFRRVAASALAAALIGRAPMASAQSKGAAAGTDRRAPGGPNAFLFHSGLVMTGLGYTPALIAAIKSDRSEDEYLYAPFAGPFLDLTAREEENRAARRLLVLDAVFQTLGLLQLVASFVYIEGPSDIRAANSSSSAWSQTAVGPARLSEDGYGLVALGRF
jgi:hypothetical protein